MYKTVLEHEMEHSYLTAGACSLSELTAETEVAASWCTKQQHGDCPLKSLVVESQTYFLKTCLVSHVAQEQSGALVRSTIMSGCLHNCGSTAFVCPALYFNLQLVWMLLWAWGSRARRDLELGGTVMSGSADQWYHNDGERQQQGWQANFQSRLKW